MSPPAHIPVLLAPILELLAPRSGETYLDCTAGLGGHSAAFALRLGPAGQIILFDLDPANLAAARARIESLPSPPRVHSFNASFSDAPRLLASAGLAADIVLADLGFASNQMDATGSAARGLSFSRDGPLDMRFNPAAPITAAELVNTLPERELAELLRDFGEEPEARRIAQKLVQERKLEPITSSQRLASIVRGVSPRRRGGQSIDPATRTFQALRIAVNDELGNLTSLLDSIERSAAASRRRETAPGGDWLAPEARIGIISFHSLEDRPVKHAFASLAERGLAVHISRKPVTADPAELAANPRSRSARFRALRLAPRGAMPD